MNSRIVLSGVLWLASAVLPVALPAQGVSDDPSVIAQPNVANPVIPEINKDAVQLQSSSNAPGVSPQSSSKSSERIFGVVPAYSITDAQNAPPLTPRKKIRIICLGHARSVPVRGLCLAKRESVKHRTAITDTGRGLPGTANDSEQLALTARRRGFLAPTRFHRCSIRILAISERAKVAPGLECVIPSLEGL